MSQSAAPAPPRISSFRTWLQLLRAPNLFTVPGDPLVGFLFANFWDLGRGLPLAILASLCFYAAGLLMNDLADEAEDLRDRPQRPLPSRAVRKSTVWIVLGLLAVAGMAALACTGHPLAIATGAALLSAIALYNWVTKSWPIIGALNMGLCRALSVMLGAVVGPQAIWSIGIYAAAGFCLYIAAVTNLARHETRDRAPALARALPLLSILIITYSGVSYALFSPGKEPAAALFVITALAVGWLAWKMFRTRTPLPPLIGGHIRVLLPLQAACCYLAEPSMYGPWAAALLLCLWPVSRIVSRWFYAS